MRVPLLDLHTYIHSTTTYPPVSPSRTIHTYTHNYVIIRIIPSPLYPSTRRWVRLGWVGLGLSSHLAPPELNQRPVLKAGELINELILIRAMTAPLARGVALRGINHTAAGPP